MHAVLEDPLSDHVEATQLLRVHVHELARPLALIPPHRIAHRAGQA